MEKKNIFHLSGEGLGYTQANKVFAIQSTLILVPYHIMIATSYVILLSVLHILDFQLDAEKIKTVFLDNHYTSLWLFIDREQHTGHYSSHTCGLN